MTGDIIILDAITGDQTTVLSGCAGSVNSLAFSSDGRLLVSGDSKYIKLWDMQTGGVIKTFHECALSVCFVPISADCTKIASASGDWIIFLWDIQTGECHRVISQVIGVIHVSFSPNTPQHLLSICRNKVWRLDLNGHEVGPTYDGSHATFSPDYTRLVLCYGGAVIVRDSSSGVIMAEFHVPEGNINCCCFSPDGRLVAIAAGSTAYVWDITSLEPHHIETFIGHTELILSLIFSSPSSLTSVSKDQSVRFWQVGVPSTHPAEDGPVPTFPTSSSIMSITLQTKNGIATTVDSDGVVRTWNISTGLCKTSYQTPAKHFYRWDTKMINGRLILVWYEDRKVNIWDCEEGEPLSIRYRNIVIEEDDYLFTGDRAPAVKDLKISGDGSRVFCLFYGSVKVWSIQTMESIARAMFDPFLYREYLCVDGLRVWAYSLDPTKSEGPVDQGWDFGIPGLLPAKLPDGSMPQPSSTLLWDACQSSIRDMTTGKVVFQLPGRFGKLSHVQLSDNYLAACCRSGELLILDFSNVLSK